MSAADMQSGVSSRHDTKPTIPTKMPMGNVQFLISSAEFVPAKNDLVDDINGLPLVLDREEKDFLNLIEVSSKVVLVVTTFIKYVTICLMK